MNTFQAIFAVAIATTAVSAAPPLSDLFAARAADRFLKESILNRDFDIDARPPSDGPTAVKTSMYVMELGFCPKHQELRLSGYLRQFWNDKRLSVPAIEEKRTTMKMRDIWSDRRIWVPDMFVAGDRGALVAATPAETGGRSFVKVESNGDVLASAKISSKIGCPVAADASEVECEFAVESYGHRAEDISYGWKPEGVLISDAAKELLRNQGWELVESATEDRTLDITQTGRYDVAVLKLKLAKIE